MHRVRLLLTVTLLLTIIFQADRLACAQVAARLQSGTANELERNAQENPPTYRRIFVDAKRVGEYVTHGRRFLPVTQIELDRLLQTVWSESSVLPHETPWIDSAFFSARLTDDRVLEGIARLDVALGGSKRRLLDLALGRISARNIEWISKDGEKKRAQGGTFGTGEVATLPRQAVLVEASGKLTFSWSKAGRRDLHGTLHFDLPLPPCHRKRLVLDLPDPLAPTIENGVMLRSSQSGAGRRQFEYVLGGSRTTALRIRDATSRADPTTAVSIRKSLRFDVDAHGAELRATFRVMPKEPSIDRLWLECGKGVHVFQVFVNDSPVKWTNHSGAAGDVVEIHRAARSKSPSPNQKTPTPNPSSATADLRPEDGRGGLGMGLNTRLDSQDGEELVSVTVRALVEQTIGQVWRLPSIRLGETTPLRSSVTLRIATTLDVQQIELSGAVQTTPALGSAREGGWQLAFEKRSPDATIDVTLTHHPERRQDKIISVVTLGERESVATTVVDITAGGEAAHVVTFPVGNAWVVDSVDTVPEGSLRDWFVRRGDDRHRLFIHPAKPIPGDQPLRIVVTGRRYGSTSAGIRPSGLRLLAPRREAATEERLFVRPVKDRGLREVAKTKSEADGPMALGLPLQNAPLPPLFGLSDDRLLFPVRLESSAAVALESKGPALAVSIHIDATVERYGDANRDPLAKKGKHFVLDQSLDIECTPQGAEVRELTVELSGVAGADVTWRLAEDDELLVARRLEQADPNTEPHVDRWQIRLPTSHTEPFHVHGRFEHRWSDRGTVGLVALEGTAQQRGRVDVRSRIGRRFHVFSSGITRIPSSPGDPRTLSSSCRSFEYNPAELISPGGGTPRAELAVELMVPPDSPESRACIVHQCRLETVMTADGTLHHTANLLLENVGDEQFSFRLPSARHVLSSETNPVAVRTESEQIGSAIAVLESITMDGRPVPLPPEDSTNHRVIDLPSDRRFPIVRLNYTTRGPALGWRQRVHLAWPSFSVPVHDWRPILYLPPGFEAPEFTWETPSVGSAMVYRLFGPFGTRPPRSADARFGPPEDEPLHGAGNVERRDRFRPASIATIDRLFASPNQAAAAEDLAGWTRCRVPMGASVTVVRRSRIRGLAVVAFLAAAALVTGGLSRRFVYLGIFASVVVCAALLLPLAYAPIASAALLGGISVWLGRSFTIAFRAVFGAAAQPTSAIFFAAVLLGSIGSRPVRCHADEPSSSSDVSGTARRVARAEGHTGPHEVLIPTGSDHQPIGDKVLITDHFYRLLLDRARESSRPPGDWSIERARYSGQLPDAVGNNRRDAWRVTLDLVTFCRDATVWLPIAKEDAMWHQDAMLDGTRIRLQWSQDGMHCRLPIAEPGRYEMVLHFVPRAIRHGGNLSIDVRVPRVADAALSIAGSNNAPLRTGLEIDGAVGQRSVGGVQEMLLENVDRLRIRWPAGQTPPAADRLIVEPYYWLHITPEAIRIDLLCRIQTDHKRVRQITVETPRDWRFVEQIAGAKVASMEPEAEKPNQLVIRFAEPTAETTDVGLRFDVLDQNRVGRLQIGHAIVLGAETKQAHWGIRLDPRLQWEALANASISPDKPEAFADVWPAGPEPPQAAYLVPGDETLQLAIWPRPAVTRARESSMVTLGGSQTGTIEFQADVELQEGECFGHTIQVSQAIRVESVRVVQNGVEKRSRWVRDEAGRVNLLLKIPLQERHAVVLKGSWYERTTKRPPLPVVHLAADDYEPAHLVVRRHAEASVAILDTAGVEAKVLASKEESESGVGPPPSPSQPPARDVNVVLADFQYDSRQGYTVHVGPSALAGARPRPLGTTTFRDNRGRGHQAARRATHEARGLEDPSKRNRVHSQQPQIVLADLTVTRRGAVDAQFLLLTAGVAEISLQLPERCVPTFFDLAGVGDAVAADGSNRWRISQSGATSPVLLRVLYQMPVGGYHATRSVRTRHIEFESPVLLWKEKPIPIRRTIWTIMPPDRWALRSSDPTLPRSAGQIAAYRWMSLCKALRDAEPVAQQLEPDLRRDWFIPWARRLASAESAARVHFEKTPPDVDLERQVRRTDEEIQRFLGRLELALVYQGVVGETTKSLAVAPDQPIPDQTDLSSQGDSRFQFFALRGNRTLTLDGFPGRDSFVRRFAAAVLFVLILCGMVPISRLWHHEERRRSIPE